MSRKCVCGSSIKLEDGACRFAFCLFLCPCFVVSRSLIFFMVLEWALIVAIPGYLFVVLLLLLFWFCCLTRDVEFDYIGS